MTGKVTIHIMVEYDFAWQPNEELSIDVTDLYRRISRLDHHDPRSPAEYKSICTPRHIVEREMEQRDSMAKYISGKLAGFVLKSFTKRDTIMGYLIK